MIQQEDNHRGSFLVYLFERSLLVEAAAQQQQQQQQQRQQKSWMDANSMLRSLGGCFVGGGTRTACLLQADGWEERMEQQLLCVTDPSDLKLQRNGLER